MCKRYETIVFYSDFNINGSGCAGYLPPLIYFCYLYNMSGALKHISAQFCKQQLLEAQTLCASLRFNFGKKSNYFPTCKDFHN
ncbi:hypothetical protein [Paraflavitalea sp. CAU 1676]|uniref:hypothetical protein n=1 Tax=Paraflavitalea sp. CAU 1676 TaxID=3032598 RepID=UPI0023DBE80A|nr:hypothetical protein [Paraflavitalea sp. CAU 1676]MDF2190773.1 hypothetical protein [Paraflavitalea sp. CAU 1676]